MLTNTTHQISRIRQEPKRRLIKVLDITDITPRMRRIRFTSPDLADFSSPSADDHIKIFLPDPSSFTGIAMRDYTPRSFDPAGRILTIDFAMHEHGLATSWAGSARAGDTLAIGGPKGSLVVADDFDYYLLVGDETALPSIGRRLEELREGVPVTAIMLVDGPQDVQHFATRTALIPVWVFRKAGEDDTALLEAAIGAWQQPSGDGYVWIAAEARTARALRDVMLVRHQHPKAWLRAAGYWVRGMAGASDKLEG